MNRQRGLRVGILLLLILAGCSKGDKKLNVEGAYTPVIANISSDHQPPVRGIPNALTALVTNPRNYAVQYHWSTSAGTRTKSPAIRASVRARPLCAWTTWIRCLRRIRTSARAEPRSTSEAIGSS